MKNIDKKILRDFGLVFAGGIATVFGLLFPLVWDRPYRFWPWTVSGIFVVIGLAAPVILSPFYYVWMKVGQVLGWINTRIILGLAFFFVFFPLGMIIRLFGRDPMARRFLLKEKSYRRPSKSSPPQQMERPF